LALWFKERYTWTEHVINVETKCKKVVNLLHSVSGYEGGADRPSLMDIYRTLIGTAIDYGCIVYETAAETCLQKLDRIQYTALRICIGAFKSPSVCV
jgi:hypothetical protein